MSGSHSHLNLTENATGGLLMNMPSVDLLGLKGKFHAQHWRCLPEFQARAEEIHRLLDEQWDQTLADELEALPRELLWEGECPNTITTEGKNSILDKYLGLGTAYAAIAVGLHTTVGNASSTYATPSPQVESVVYSNGTRGVPSFSAASAGSKTTSSAVGFSINGSASITGMFLALGAAGVTTKSDTAATAVLFATTTFSGGTRSVISGDTLNVSYTLSA